MPNRLLVRPLLALVAAGLVLGACGNDGNGAAPDPVDTGSAQPATTGTSASSDTPAPGSSVPVESTAAPTTAAPTTAVPTTVPGVPWSTTADEALAAVTAAVMSGTGTVDVLDTLFAAPVDVPLPADAALSSAVVDATVTDGGWEIVWSLTAASAATPADLEAAVTAGFADDRFEAGARVVSTLDSGVFVTLNHPPTDAAAADGWDLLTITVGPETDFGTATGRNEIEVFASRTVDGDATIVHDLLGAFLTTWVDEMPAVPADASPTGIRGQLVLLDGPPSVWLDATWAADPASFADLVTYYAQDLSAGPLVLDASSPPTDLSTADRFVAGFFPTLAGHDIWVTVSRDLTLPDDAVEIFYEVRLDPLA